MCVCTQCVCLVYVVCVRSGLSVLRVLSVCVRSVRVYVCMRARVYNLSMFFQRIFERVHIEIVVELQN